MTRRFLTLLATLSAAAAAPAQGLPPDLALVPEGSYAFVHLRLADLANGPALAGYRQSLAAAGPEALSAFDRQFVPAPRTTERITAALVPKAGPGSEPLPLVIVRFSEAFDAKKVVATYSDGAPPKRVGRFALYAADRDTSFAVADDRTIVAGPEAALRAAAQSREPSPGLAKRLLEAAAYKGVLFAGVSRRDLPPFPPGFDKDVPPQFRPLLKVVELTLTADLGGALSGRLRAKYPTEADAKAAEAAVLDAAREGRKQVAALRQKALGEFLAAPPPAGRGKPLDELPGALVQLSTLAGLTQADQFLAAPPLKRVGDTLEVGGSTALGGTESVAVAAVGVGLLLPAVQKVREAAARAQSQNNLKQIALAMIISETNRKKFPAAAVTSADGKPLLSWRVAILPYIEQDALYKRFKLDEPWDSEHNKPLIALMPRIYVDPRMPPTPGLTTYKVFTGKSGSFDLKTGRTINSIKDGASNTVLAASGGDPVTWTKPEDFVFDGDALPDLRTPLNLLLVVMFDGSTRAVLLDGVDAKLLKAMITPAGGEAVGP